MKESKFYQEVVEEGRLEARRADIIDVLTERFGARAAAQFRGALNDIEDENQLSHLVRRAAGSPRLADFRQSLTLIAPEG